MEFVVVSKETDTKGGWEAKARILILVPASEKQMDISGWSREEVEIVLPQFSVTIHCHVHPSKLEHTMRERNGCGNQLWLWNAVETLCPSNFVVNDNLGSP